MRTCHHCGICGVASPRKAGEDFTLETKAGVLAIGVAVSDDEGPLIVMDQGTSQFAAFNGSRDALAGALGIAESDLHVTLPIVYGSTGRWTLVVPIRDRAAMQRLRPIQAEFAAALCDKPDASIHPFCSETIDPHASMHARHFSSLGSGTLEDAVTGTASGVLGAYYRQFIDGSDGIEQPLVVEQGFEVGREGSVQVWAAGQGGSYAVRIAGRGCFVEDIKIHLP